MGARQILEWAYGR